MIEIVPVLLPETFDEISTHAARVRGLVKRMQIDIVDGVFAESLTWPYVNDTGDFERLTHEDEGLPFWDELDFEVDMMVQNPEEVLPKWISAGVSACIIHIGSTKNYDAIIEKCKTADIEAGLAIRPGTAPEEFEPLIKKFDFVQVMGSDTIGHAGLELDEYVYAKISDIRAKHSELSIAVDIGVNEDTAPQLIEAGATKLVAGSAIFGSDDIKETIEYLKNL
ncbi:MAG: hypothetical protein AAB460_03155 [Patescibacteria group bacterium]